MRHFTKLILCLVGLGFSSSGVLSCASGTGGRVLDGGSGADGSVNPDGATDPDSGSSSCDGVVCNTPGPDQCVDETALREFDANGTCVQGACEYTYTDTYCPSGNWCDTDACVTCDDDLHCGTACTDCSAAGQICNTDGTACVGCILDGDCAAGNWCSGGVCTPCNTNDHCGASCTDCTTSGQMCDTVGTACVQCNVDGDCGAGNWCSGGACAVCNTDSHCGSSCADCTAVGTMCSAAGTACVQCNTDGDCPAGNWCNGAVCAACNTDTHCGAACTDCTASSQVCDAGACVTQNVALFFEDWEDGNYSGWTTGTAGSPSVTSSTAANGTSYSLYVSGGTTHYQGLYRTFSSLTPSRIEWWARSASSTSSDTYFVIHGSSSTGTTNQMTMIYFRDSGQIQVVEDAGSVPARAYSANTWYHLELRNISWSGHTFELWVDGVSEGTFTFRSSTVSVLGRLDLYNFNGSGWWDEIAFHP